MQSAPTKAPRRGRRAARWLLVIGFIIGTGLVAVGCAHDQPLSGTSATAQPKSSESPKAPGNGGILNGKDFTLMIAAPNGWVMDTSAGARQHLAAVFYPHGESWTTATTVMYLNAINKRVTGFKSAGELIASDFKAYRQHYPDVVMEQLPDRQHPDKPPMLMRKYTNPSTKHYDLTAYINEETIITVLSLDASTPEELTAHTADFEKLLDSYVFVTTNVP